MTITRDWMVWTIATVVATAGFSGVSRAAEAPADTVQPVTLDDYLRLARAANRSVMTATSAARAARERVGVAKGMPDPRVLYSYTFWSEESAHDPSMKGRNELALSQEFPFPGKRGLRGEVASREAAMAGRMAATTALDVEFEVKSAFYQYVGLTEVALVLDTESDVLQRMREVALVRYESGKAEQQEVLKVELELAQLADAGTLNAREVQAARARLNELIGRNAERPLPAPSWVLPDTLALHTPALTDTALARRPEIFGAREEIEMASAAHRLAKKEYIPDFMLGVSYEFGGGELDWWELMAGVNLPIWLGKRGAMVREAEARREAAEHRLAAEQLRTSREVEEAAWRARAAHDRLERFRTVILPLAEQAFASSEAGYRSGRVDFLDYLDSERALLGMRRDYAMVVADLGMQMAALERAVGVTPRGR